MADAWTIEWFICRMDSNDVKFAKKEGNANAKIGDELWRVPLAIGPIGADHNHWSGACLSGEPEDWRLAAAAPVLLALLESVQSVEYITLDDVLKGRIADIIQQIKLGET